MQVLIEKYKEKGLKITPQRLAIFKFLEGNTTHPTADDIYKGVKIDNPTISFATVYNTIEALKGVGEVMELTIDPERKHYDPNTEPHHHVVCLKCNKFGDVFVDYSKDLKLPETVTSEFKISGNHVNFYGVCSDCD
ncbi:MAG: transcriptional repressor [Deltaproteobacteria bacterium]|nr:transcriptional repressor [Deltaproteobacteria bacterium]